jgi:hypothetical protein
MTRREHAAAAALTLALSLGFSGQGRAADTWRDVRPGIHLLHRTTDAPQDLWVARIDLSLPNIGLHASADTAGERGVNTLQFARSADTLVAINTDWSNGRTPVGLAIADGARWHDHFRDAAIGGHWGYFGCTAGKACTFGWEERLGVAWWFERPELPPYRFFQAHGTNGCPHGRERAGGQRLLRQRAQPAQRALPRGRPRAFELIVVDGRRGGAAGMTCDEIRDLMLEFGCQDGAMLDGGGSSTLVVEDVVKNQPSDGALRTVSNHLGIIYTDAVDPRCDVANGRFCSGTVISTCQGGRFQGSGDCGAFGAGCEEDADYAYCVHPFCPGGRGQGAECTGATTLRQCRDGFLPETDADCGAFGLVCGADAAGAGCMEARCQAGPNSPFCAGPALAAACAAGVYAETPCAAGTHCDAGACVPDAPPPGPTPDAAPPPPPGPTPDAGPTPPGPLPPDADFADADAPDSPDAIDGPSDPDRPDALRPGPGPGGRDAQTGAGGATVIAEDPESGRPGGRRRSGQRLRDDTDARSPDARRGVRRRWPPRGRSGAQAATPEPRPSGLTVRACPPARAHARRRPRAG